MPTRDRVPLHFGEGLDREHGLLTVSPVSMFDLRNCFLHEGRVIVRPGFTAAGVGDFDEVSILLGGEALRTERLGIVAGWEPTTRQVFVYRVTPDLSVVELLGEWSNDNGWGDNVPRIIFAEVFGRVFMAHDEPGIAKRAPTIYYDGSGGESLKFLTSTWADGVIGESAGESAESVAAPEDRIRFRGVVRHLSYLVGWGFGTLLEPRPEFLRISLPSDPTSFDPNHYFIVGDRGVPIIGAAPVGGDPGILKVFKRQEAHDLLGTDRRSFGIFLADSRYGLVAGRAVVQVGGSAISWSEEGPRVWSGPGASSDLEIPLGLDDWEPADLVDEGEEENAFAHFIPRERVAWFQFNRRVYALTTRIPGRWRWSYHELPFDSYGALTLFQGETEALAPAGFPDYNAPGESTNPTEPGGSFVDVAWRNFNQEGDETVEVWLREAADDVNSGAEFDDGGVTKGYTDFSEYSTGAGIPADFNHDGLADPGVVDTFEIADAGGDVGHFFRMGGATSTNQKISFWTDAFAGPYSGEFEILARVWVEHHPIGASGDGCGPLGVIRTGPTVWVGGIVRTVTAADFESLNKRHNGTGPSGDISEAEQPAGAWMWIRYQRELQSGASYHNRGKAWYGDYGDEPAGWDYDGTQNQTQLSGAIGWGGFQSLVNGVGASDQHRIAFLSFSTDPSSPALGPGELPSGEAGDWFLAGSFPVSTAAQQQERVTTGIEPGKTYDVALRYRRGLLYNAGAEDTDNPDTWPSVSRGQFSTTLDNPTIESAVWARNSSVEEGITLTIVPDPDNADADIKVYRHTTVGSSSLLTTLNGPHADPLEYEDTTISGETPYWYSVTHEQGSNESPQSDETRVWAGPPEIPVHEYLNGLLEAYQLGWSGAGIGANTDVEIHDTYDDNGGVEAFSLRGTEESDAATGEFTTGILANIPVDGIDFNVRARMKETAFTIVDFGEFSVSQNVAVEGSEAE